MDKFAGLFTQISDLKKKLKKHDPSKSPKLYKETLDALEAAEKRYDELKKKKEDRKKAKEEATKTEATVQPTDVVKESAPAPTEVTKESDTTHFAVDAKVEPTRGTAGSWGTVIRSSGTNGDPLCYVKWAEGPLKAREEYGAYYESDLKMKVEKEAISTDYVPREKLYDLEADLRGNYERMISDLQEEIKTAQEKGEYAWVGRLEEKLADAQKAYDEKYSKKAEDENGSGGSEKLKVVDLTPAHDKDPQEKSTGYGGDRPYGAMVSPNRDENSLPLEGSKKQAAEFSGHGLGQGLNDLYVLPSSPEEAQKIEEYLKQNGRSYQWSLSNVEGQSWHGKRFIEIPFGEGLKGEIEKLVGGTVEASLGKQAMNITVAEKLFIVNPLQKTADNEYVYDVTIGANNQKLFKITSKDEMGQEHLAYVIEKELTNKKEAASRCAICGQKFEFYSQYVEHQTHDHDKKEYTPMDPAKKKEVVRNFEKGNPAIIGKLTSNLAFLKKGSFVSILDVDKEKKQIKFASLDGSLRGWAPQSKFAAYDVPEANLVDHEGHKDEVLSSSGNELLVSCPANSINIIWRTIEAPPATPESLNPDVTASTDKEARGCDQCEATMINGVFCHETGCPNSWKGSTSKCKWCGQPFVPQERGQEFDDESCYAAYYNLPMPEEMGMEGALNINAHIRHEDGKWVIYSHNYKKKLGTYDTEAEAKKRLAEIEAFKHMKGSLQPLSKKEANVMETKCEECGKELGPEVFLSKHPVCGKCTKKRHEKAVGKRAETKLCPVCGQKSTLLDDSKGVNRYRCDVCHKIFTGNALTEKKADQEISLEQQVAGFKERMQTVNDRLANPPAKTADLETTQDLDKVDPKDLSEDILHMIDMLESKVGTDVSADPEIHGLLEELENKVYEIEIKLGIKPTLPEHEKLEPEHKEIVEEVGKESAVEVISDSVNTPPTTLPPAGFRYAWDPKNMSWILVQISDAPGGGY